MRGLYFACVAGILALGSTECASAQGTPTELQVAAKLCDLETKGFSRDMKADAGRFVDNVLAIPSGDNALRVQATFVTMGDDSTQWLPTFAVFIRAAGGHNYTLRYSYFTGDSLLRIRTEVSDDNLKTGSTNYEFDNNPGMTAELKADISWTSDGIVKVTDYSTSAGFDGPGETTVYNLGAPISVRILTSTSEVNVESLRFGKTTCPTT